MAKAKKPAEWGTVEINVPVKLLVPEYVTSKGKEMPAHEKNTLTKKGNIASVHGLKAVRLVHKVRKAKK